MYEEGRRLWIVSTFLIVAALAALTEDRIDRGLLIEDTRYLARTLERSHPDPYLNGGGKVAFHRRLHQTLRTIPEEGMTTEEFYRLLLPFVASVKDGHTSLSSPAAGASRQAGLPFEFIILDGRLHVSQAFSRGHRELLAARFEGIGDLRFRDLELRMQNLRGADNKYGNLINLGSSLRSRRGLNMLVPELAGLDRASVTFTLRGGKRKRIQCAFVDSIPRSRAIGSPSSIQLPTARAGEPAYRFLSERRKVALLRIDTMLGYREYFEWARNAGYQRAEDTARDFYRDYHRADPPPAYDDVFFNDTAATETYPPPPHAARPVCPMARKLQRLHKHLLRM